MHHGNMRSTRFDLSWITLQRDLLGDVVDTRSHWRSEARPVTHALAVDATLDYPSAEHVGQPIVQLHDAPGAVVTRVVAPCGLAQHFDDACLTRAHSDSVCVALPVEGLYSPCHLPACPTALARRHARDRVARLRVRRNSGRRAVRHRGRGELCGKLRGVDDIAALDRRRLPPAVARLAVTAGHPGRDPEQQPTAHRDMVLPGHDSDAHVASGERALVEEDQADEILLLWLEASGECSAAARRVPRVRVAGDVDANLRHMLILARAAAPTEY
mmetsp:Transcript_64712/g.127898  ORF Transcript_64712/g.127898 Transcript_64712/m.127898 type:complete len:272 (-) Transcript_64712:577-1392(-)